MKNGLRIEYGAKRYYLNDKLHREDGPACEWPDECKEWFINGKTHRDGNLPAIEWICGDKAYCLHGKLHREDGPALDYISKSSDRYYIGDLCQNLEEAHKSKDSPYYLNGKNYSKEEYWKEIERRKSLNIILLNVKSKYI